MFGLWFAEALEHFLGEGHANTNHDNYGQYRESNQSLLSPSLLHCFLKTKKKGKLIFWLRGCYGRFLSTRISIIPTIAIAAIMAAVDAAKYISVGGKVTTGYGDDVGAAAPT